MSRKYEDSGMGLLGLLALGGLVAWIGREGRKNREEAEQRAAQENWRRNSKCRFDDGISEPEFAEVAIKAAKKIKRVKNISVSGPTVCGEVESQSGISTWDFYVDFNDYGHITGKYWIRSENDDSSIPRRIGEMISEQLLQLTHAETAQTVEDDFYDSDDDVDKPIADENTANALQTKKKRKGHIVFILLTLLCSVGFLTYNYWQYSKLIFVGSASSSFNNQDYSDAYEVLTGAGFSNIYLNEIFDLTYDQKENEGRILSVIIDGADSFASSDKFPYDAKVIISYHGLKPVVTPVTSKGAKGVNYIDIQTAFNDAGFVNIVLEPIPDIVLGWFVKDGEVDAVLVNGESKYSEGAQYRPDVEVVIKYHTLKAINND